MPDSPPETDEIERHTLLLSKARLLDLLASWHPLNEGLPEVEDAPPQPRDEL